MSAVHIVLPEGVDDPRRPSGGNTYDRRVSRGLAATGWTVHVHQVPGSWPRPDTQSTVALAEAVSRIPDGAVALFDGLVASAAPDVLVPESRRVRLVALVHMPLGHDPADDRAVADEGAVLSTAASVVTTSAWARRRLLDLYSLAGDRVHVSEPGTDAAGLAPGTATGEALLSVAAVVPDKGHDVLLEALSTVTALRWRCACAGSLERDPAFAEKLRRQALRSGIDGQLRFCGPQIGAELARSYETADLLVHASRAETYGMVITEALARGLPVVAADVGGVSEALGHGAGGTRPGLLVPPGDPTALSNALHRWLEDAGLRQRLRRAARERRASLTRWSRTTAVVAGVLAEAAR